jgi:hypothetical protein
MEAMVEAVAASGSVAQQLKVLGVPVTTMVAMPAPAPQAMVALILEEAEEAVVLPLV